MYEWTIERLESAGLEMYEISNFARPGHESRHNLAYWANDAYFGFGVGAARYLTGSSLGQHARPECLSSPDRIGRAGHRAQRRAVAGSAGTRDRDADAAPDSGRHRRDDFLMQNRIRPGRPAGRAIARFVAQGLLEDDGQRVRLTREGLFVADQVLCEFL